MWKTSLPVLARLGYLGSMDNRYITLAILAQIVLEMTQPTQYACTTREMILHSTFDWELIHKHLQSLAEEGMVVISHADTLQFSITQAGLDKIAELEQIPGKEITISFRDASIEK